MNALGKRCVKVFAALIAVTCAASVARAQGDDNNPRQVMPERPTVATHAHTVAPGYVEVETGVQADRASQGMRSLSSPTVIKVGLGTHLQLGIGVPANLNAVSQTRGVGDLGLSLKWRVLDEHPVLGDFAIQPAAKFATASSTNGLGTGATDVGVTLISSHMIHDVAMDLNAAYTRTAVGRDNADDQALWTASFGLPVTKRVGWVVEFFGNPTIDGSGAASTAALLTGPTLSVSPAFAVDLGIITPFHGDMPNAVYAGFVWNLGKLLPFKSQALRAQTASAISRMASRNRLAASSSL